MRNYNQQVEAAYLLSKRQGNMTRDRELERSAHANRRNRYIEHNPQPGARRYDTAAEARGDHALDSYRPADSNYNEILDDSHRGKGPRNYRRSDERIKEIVCDTFCDHPYLDASGIEVEVKNSEVILKGFVDDRYAKRLAEDLVENISGVTQVENRIRVNQDQKLMYQRERVNQEII